MSTEKKVFVRKATGLVREIGFWTAAIIILCNVIGLGWQKRLFQFTGPAIVPESSYPMGIPPVTMSFIIVGIIVLLTVFMFAVLGAAMPRSGGGYVYISRIIHPAVGFLASWLEYFSIAVSWGLIGTAVFEAILIYAWIAGWGTAWATAEILLVGGMIIVVLFTGVAYFGASMTGKILQFMFIVPAAITIVLYGILLSSTSAAVEAGVKMITGLSATQFTQMALDQGMATAYAGDYWGAMATASIGTYWAYIGFAAATFVGGEVKEAGKALPKTLFTANVIILLLYVTISYLVAHTAMGVGKVGDYSFFSSYAFLSYGGGELPAGIGRAWMPNIAGFAAAGMGLTWFLMLIPIFAVFWVANDIPPFIITSSRIIFAMSFDRVLPEKLSEVNERWHSPTAAILVTMLVAFIGNFAESDIFVKYPVPILTEYINSGGGVAATDIWDTAFFLLASLAGMLFVFRRKDIYDKSPYKPGKSLVAVIGALATVANLYLLYLVATGWWFAEPWIFTLFLLVVGAIIYYYYRSKGSRVGVDYATIYAEIPPE
ncbi:MAG: APC family permease [Candidatus Bathyarchaeia archaeon]